MKKYVDIEKRFYRTGDIVFKDQEDCFFYIGRKDNQVKIQGYRIELSEIEKHSRDFTGSESVVAIPCKTLSGIYQISLFAEQGNYNSESILEFLKLQLPYYMIPSNIVILEKIPVNKNGKIDRVTLLKMCEHS